MALLDEVVMTGQNAATLEEAHHLLRTLTSNPRFSSMVDTAGMLEEVLEGVGFGGLWKSCSFHVGHGRDRECTALTDRLIEVGRGTFSHWNHMLTIDSLSLHNPELQIRISATGKV